MICVHFVGCKYSVRRNHSGKRTWGYWSRKCHGGQDMEISWRPGHRNIISWRQSPRNVLKARSQKCLGSKDQTSSLANLIPDTKHLSLPVLSSLQRLWFYRILSPELPVTKQALGLLSFQPSNVTSYININKNIRVRIHLRQVSWWNKSESLKSLKSDSPRHIWLLSSWVLAHFSNWTMASFTVFVF